MRFLVREQAYEALIASGRFRFENNDRPTGAVEHWRLTRAAQDYTILRVDLDARAAPSGDSYLYHCVLSSQGVPERVLFRFWSGSGVRVEGNVFLDPELISLSRTVADERFEQEINLTQSPVPTVFWFPSVTGLHFVGRAGRSNSAVRGITLDPSDHFSLSQTDVRLRCRPPELITVMGQSVRAAPVAVQWRSQERQLWLDDHDWPLRMERTEFAGGMLAAVESRMVRHSTD